MHTTGCPSGTYFIHNGDFSGVTLIGGLRLEPRMQYGSPFSLLAAAVLAAGPAADDSTPVSLVVRHHQGAWHFDDAGVTIQVPLGDLRHLMGVRVLSERVSALESLSLVELLELGVDVELPEWAAGSAAFS